MNEAAINGTNLVESDDKGGSTEGASSGEAFLWIALAGFFVLFAGFSNWLLPFPDINDFASLARICLLMEESGARYSVNNNWGFGLPLFACGLTEVTGDLLVAQRILAAAFSALALVFANGFMRSTLGVESPLFRGIFLITMLLSPWMNEAVLSVHLDIIPITLYLAALNLLASKKTSGHLWGGVLVGAGYWFRFHFLLFALCYVVLTLVYRWGDRHWRRGALGGVGLALALSVPILLTLSTFGVPMLSNAKSILALRADLFSWTVTDQLAVERTGYWSILKQVNWPRVAVGQAIRLLANGAFSLFFVIVGVHVGRRAWIMRREAESKTPWGWAGALCASLKGGPVSILLVVSLGWLLLLILRGPTLRLEAFFWFLAIPALAGIWMHCGMGVQRGLILGLCALCIGKVPNQLLDRYYQRIQFDAIDTEVAGTIPKEFLRDQSEKVLSLLGSYYNQESKYRHFSPVLIGGWSTTWGPFRDAFGVLDPRDTQTSESLSDFEYIILSNSPVYDFERFDESFLSVRPVVFKGERVTILGLG